MSPAPLSVSIVTYEPDARHFARALASLAAAVDRARAAGAVSAARVFVVDNGPEAGRQRIAAALAAWPPHAGAIELVAGHGNVGFGRGNNQVLARLDSEIHVVMNPDVELDPEALLRAVEALRAHPEVGLATPAVFEEDGTRQYLCRRYPSVWVLFLRGFAPAALRRRFARRLAHYEMRDLVGERFVAGVPLASGCFMVTRTALLKRLGGFDPRFFMYFEDYDLSVRLGREAQIAYVPEARIVHHGGDAAGKGPRHIAWFLRSAWRFFSTHGWKLT